MTTPDPTHIKASFKAYQKTLQELMDVAAEELERGNYLDAGVAMDRASRGMGNISSRLVQEGTRINGEQN